MYANSTLIEQGMEEPLSVLGTDFLGYVLKQVGGSVGTQAVGPGGITFTAGGGYYMDISYALKPGMGKAVGFCPSLWGGKDWPPEAYNPQTGLFYIPANNNLCAELPKADPATPYKKGDLYIGYPLDGVLGSLRFGDKPPETIGELQA